MLDHDLNIELKRSLGLARGETAAAEGRVEQMRTYMGELEQMVLAEANARAAEAASSEQSADNLLARIADLEARSVR